MFVIVQIVLIVSISTLEKSKGSIPPKLPAVPGPGQCDPEGPALQKVGERRPMLDCWMRQDAHPGICVRRVEDFRRSRLMAFLPSLLLPPIIYHSGYCFCCWSIAEADANATATAKTVRKAVVEAPAESTGIRFRSSRIKNLRSIPSSAPGWPLSFSLDTSRAQILYGKLSPTPRKKPIRPWKGSISPVKHKAIRQLSHDKDDVSLNAQAVSRNP